MKKPVIGIALDYSAKKIADGGYADFPWYALRMNYAHAISQHGGVPVFIPYESRNIQDYLKLCNGLLLPGGDIDIHPSIYGEKVSVKNINLDPNNTRTAFEFKLIRAALKKRIPILAICAGFQALNVAQGGSLYQDIAEQLQTKVNHRDAHIITTTKGSLLNKITGKTSYKVNSFHHQAAKKLGRALKASAASEDGIIEAIELNDYPFCIGVEWHPEFQDTKEDRALFKAFVKAAKVKSSLRSQ